MKKFLFLLTALSAIFIWTSASAQVFKNDELTISSLGNKVWVIETYDNTTMYLVEGDEKALLIDTGTKCKKLDEVIRQITQKPLFVVLTHAHHDHAGNIGSFSEVYLHRADTVLLDKSYKGKLHFVDDGSVFELGNRPIRVVHMPAHTPGSIVLLDKQTESCFSGDAFGSGQVWLQLKPTAPMVTYVGSLKKMTAIMNQGITKIYCGHYPYIKKAFEKDYILAMIELAESLDNGTAPTGKPFAIKVSIGCENPMIVSNGPASIVYDPDHLK
jgi:hydroxyacylglutathione hydrolase